MTVVSRSLPGARILQRMQALLNELEHVRNVSAPPQASFAICAEYHQALGDAGCHPKHMTYAHLVASSKRPGSRFLLMIEDLMLARLAYT